MTDHEKTIRTALERAFQITSKEPCGPSNNLMIEALASLTALQEERERMQAALGRIARLITHSLIPDTNEIYHQCYMALVGDLTLPASQQAEIMRAAIEGAAMEPAPQLNRDEKWLREKAALEDGCFVSVGGLVTDLESPTTRPSDIDAATGTADDQIPTAVVDAMRAYVEGTGVTTVQYIETALSAASVETEDAATLRGDQSQQVEPCPHCAAGVPMSSQPGTHWNGDIVGIPCEGQSCPTCGQRENIVCSDAYHLTGTWKDGKPVKACECPHTKALRDLQSALDELELQHDPEKDAEAERLYECAREKARVALNTPCPCEGLRAEPITTAERESAAYVARERDSLRDALAAKDKHFLETIDAMATIEIDRNSLRAELATADVQEKWFPVPVVRLRQSDSGHDSGRIRDRGEGARVTVCAIMLADGRPEMVARAIECFHHQMNGDAVLHIYDTSPEPLAVNVVDAVVHHYRPEMRGRTIGELRNSAILEAGEYDVIVHWDSDDWSHPSRIDEQVALLKATGADCVGYSDLLFYDTTRGQFSGAWMYTTSAKQILPETTFCYWRKAWERRPFEHVKSGEGLRWLLGGKINIAGVTSCSAEPRMIASIHGSNTSSRISAGNPEWRRVPEWDEHCRKIMNGDV